MGHDSRSCGSPRTPCKSIAHAVRQVDWGGHIYIDGTGTEKDPFACNSGIEHAYNPGIYINKSVIMKGFQSRPHVLCIHGINFQKSSEEQRALNVLLSQISFLLTPIVFEDCSQVEISNCSLQGASTAGSVLLRNLSTSFLLNIQSSQFQNNSQCIELLLSANNVNQYDFITINVEETIFHENGVHGILTIRASDEENVSTLRDIQVNIYFYKVRSCKNRGLFVRLDLQTALTNETYRDILLQDNALTKRSGNKKNGHSLYTSQAKETLVNFSHFSCINNRFLRCLKIRSQRAQVNIRNSSFVGQSIYYRNGAALSLESKIRASLVISNSEFKRNAADKGGAVYAYSAYGTLALNFTNVNFTRCSARRYGCAVLVGKPKHGGCEYSQGRYELTASFRKVNVAGSNGKRGKFTCIQLFLNNGTVAVDKFTWLRNFQAINGALNIQTTGGRARVTISRSKFIENSVSTGSALMLLALKEAAGSLTIFNSSFVNRNVKGKRAIMVTPKYRIELVKVSITHFSYGLQIHTTCVWNKVFPINVLIDSCNFTDNKNDMNIMIRDPASVRLTVKGTIFAGQQRTERSYAIRFHIRPLKILNVSSADIKLDNVLFDSKPSSNFALFFQGNKSFKIRRSVFRNCISLHPVEWRFQNTMEADYITGTGGISILTVPDKPRPQNPGCVQAGDHNNTHPLWDYDSHVFVEDSTFQENAGLVVGAIYVSNGNATFKRCTFKDNFAIQRAGHAYFAYGTGRVKFVDCIFKKTRKGVTANNTAFNKSTFLYSETGGPIILLNTSMYSFDAARDARTALEISNGGYVEIDQRSTVQCSQGSRLLFERTTHFAFTDKRSTFCWINITGLKYSCSMCSPGFYSLQRGISRGLYPNETFHCLQCPFGATCVQSNIAAQPNFWGYHVSQHPPTLRFISCPENYCRSPTSDSLYNGCHGNRSGTLCGACATGFTETLFSAECQKETECKNHWVWLLMILFTAGFALYMLKKPPLVSSLGKQLLWFKTKTDSRMTQHLGHSHSDDGHLKIIFYFYQAAKLIMIGSLETLIHNKIPVIHVLLAAFNFSVLTVDRRIGCPFAGLTAVTKEVFLCLPVFCTMAMICLFYCIHNAINILRDKKKPALIDYMAVFMEILLLGYERLAETSLKLMHCVNIRSEKRLFLDGNIHCWQWWQYLVLLYNLVFVIPFILVLYWGSFMLHSSSISTRGFLGACILPLPFIIFWSFKYIFKKRDVVSTQESNEDVLKVFHGPFRPPSDDDPGTLYWESVLIGRRFILLTFQAFVTNPMLRMVGITGACVLMTLHHFAKQPYRSPLANKAETLSLTTLVIMAVINHTKATLVSFGVTSEGPNKSYLETFEWFEVCTLGFVPTLLFTLAVLAILSQLVRLLVFVVKHFRRWAEQLCAFHLSQDAKSTPLLGAATPNYGTHSEFTKTESIN